VSALPEKKAITPSPDWLYPDLAYQVVGGLYEVHSVLGAGFVYRIYANACCLELGLRGLAVKPGKRMQVSRSRTPRLADAPGGFVRYTGAGPDGLGWNLFDAQSVKNVESGRLPPTTREGSEIEKETISLGIDAHFEHIERGRLHAVHA
jgi:hypothetical protein